MEEGGTLVQPICAVCLEEVIVYVAGKESKKEINENAETMRNVFPKNDVEILVNLLKDTPQDQACPQPLGSVYMSVWRGRVIIGG